jgi:hypothetical protein
VDGRARYLRHCCDAGGLYRGKHPLRGRGGLIRDSASLPRRSSKVAWAALAGVGEAAGGGLLRPKASRPRERIGKPVIRFHLAVQSGCRDPAGKALRIQKFGVPMQCEPIGNTPDAPENPPFASFARRSPCGKAPVSASASAPLRLSRRCQRSRGRSEACHLPIRQAHCPLEIERELDKILYMIEKLVTCERVPIHPIRTTTLLPPINERHGIYVRGKETNAQRRFASNGQ